jgi:hypothetical protein
MSHHDWSILRAVSVSLMKAVLSAGVAFDEAERVALDTDGHLKTAGVKS